MKSLSPEEEKIIRDIRNLLRTKKNKVTLQLNIRNLFRLEKEAKAIKDRRLTDIKNLFKHEEKEENYYKPIRASNF